MVAITCGCAFRHRVGKSEGFGLFVKITEKKENEKVKKQELILFRVSNSDTGVGVYAEFTITYGNRKPKEC